MYLCSEGKEDVMGVDFLFRVENELIRSRNKDGWFLICGGERSIYEMFGFFGYFGLFSLYRLDKISDM